MEYIWSIMKYIWSIYEMCFKGTDGSPGKLVKFYPVFAKSVNTSIQLRALLLEQSFLDSKNSLSMERRLLLKKKLLFLLVVLGISVF